MWYHHCNVWLQDMRMNCSAGDVLAGARRRGLPDGAAGRRQCLQKPAARICARAVRQPLSIFVSALLAVAAQSGTAQPHRRLLPVLFPCHRIAVHHGGRW